MYCYKCGTELPDNAMFCSCCGSHVEQTKPTNPLKQPQGKKTLLITVLCAVLVVCLGAGLWFGLFKDSVPAENPIEANNSDGLLEEPIPTAAPDIHEEEPYAIASGVDGCLEYVIMSDNTVKIVDCIGEPSSIVFPSTIEGLPVTTIGEYFCNYDFLTEVIIPESVTTLADCALSGCSSLVHIQLPDSISEIGEYALISTPWLDNKTEDFIIVGQGILIKYNGTDPNVTIPDDVKKINGAFCRIDTEIETVYIPYGVTEIAADSFRSCNRLSSVHIPKSVSKIGNHAFYYCTSLTQVDISENVSYIGCEAFIGTPWLDNQSEDYVIVGQNILLDYNGFSSTVVIPDTVRSTSSAFYENSYIREIHIPSDVSVIGGGTFMSCPSLEYVQIPDGVKAIGYHAFTACENLSGIFVPQSVYSVESFAFSECPNINNLQLSNQIRTIDFGTFYNLDGLTHFTIPDNVTMLEYGAFLNNASLNTVYIPESVVYINKDAFLGCDNVTLSVKKIPMPTTGQ